MITNFKIYELFSPFTYEVGDYVLIKIIRNNNDYNLFQYAKIVNILSESTYRIEAILNDEVIFMTIHNDRFRRPLTPKEIKEFELKKDSLKYNI